MAWVNPYPIMGKYRQLDETTTFLIEQCRSPNPANPKELCTRMAGHVEAGSPKHGTIPNINTGMDISNVHYWD